MSARHASVSVYDRRVLLYNEDYKAGSVVWRYMQLWKFLDLIKTSELHFTRLDYLDDPYEHALVAAACKREPKNSETVFATCWHFSDEASPAMWKQYAGEAGVAIQSSKLRLILVLEELKFQGISFHSTASGAVRYCTDEEMARFLQPAGRIDNMVPAFNKHKSYCHEQEFRLAISLAGESRPEPHFRLRVNIDDLIERVSISTRIASSQEFQDAMSKFGKSLKVIPSRY